MSATIICSHCEQAVAAGKYYEHLVLEHGEDED